jgi:hypothetical protein
LRRGARTGDDQRRVISHADFADGGPRVDLKRARDPGDDGLILLGMRVDPAEGVLRLLSWECCGEEGCEESKRKKTPEGDNLHGTRYTRGGAEPRPGAGLLGWRGSGRRSGSSRGRDLLCEVGRQSGLRGAGADKRIPAVVCAVVGFVLRLAVDGDAGGGLGVR